MFLEFTSATDQNIQLCETKIPESKLGRLRSRKTPSATVQSHEAGPRHATEQKKNQFLKYCIKIC